MKTQSTLIAFACLLTFSHPSLGGSLSGTLAGDYFIMDVSDADTCHGTGPVLSDLVLPHLGPDGLPIYNPSNSGNYVVHDLYKGEITWWFPAHNSRLTMSSTPSGTITFPFQSGQMFPPAPNSGGNDNNSFLTAHFYGSITMPTTGYLDFSMAADDEAFLYIDGVSIGQIGGVVKGGSGTAQGSTLNPLAAGSHTIDLFYADLAQAGASLTIQLGVSDVAAVPEPNSLLLLAIGTIGLHWARRRANH